MRQGLQNIGLDAGVTESRYRESDIAILLGTTLWRNIEDDGRYLLVDRASIGDPYYVSLVWDGHGRRGNHCAPQNPSEDRWAALGVELSTWRSGSRRVLCGQTETYSPHYLSLDAWYSAIDATHFRRHPRGTNPTGLPEVRDWNDCGLAITLNSSVAVDAVISGIPTVTMDGGAMAWDVSGHSPDEVITPDRQPWVNWLAWTQWNYDEIRRGTLIRHLFEDL